MKHTCMLGHIYGDPFPFCPFCDHEVGAELEERIADSINIGDNEHQVEVVINEETTEQKGEIIV